jgi:hypothetical protein
MGTSAKIAGLGVCMMLTTGEAGAEIMFAVTSQDIVVCSELGGIAAELSELKHRGVSKEETLDASLETGLLPEVSQAVVNVLFSFEASDPNVYKSVMGAFCLKDKLAPVVLPD